MSSRWTIKYWYYSLILLLIYLLSFHLWTQFQNRAFFIISGLIMVSLATGLLVWAKGKNYFINRVDLTCHILVIIDLALEALLYEISKILFPIKSKNILLIHDDMSFYYCAIAFAVVIVLFRLRGKNSPEKLKT